MAKLRGLALVDPILVEVSRYGEDGPSVYRLPAPILGELTSAKDLTPLARAWFDEEQLDYHPDARARQDERQEDRLEYLRNLAAFTSTALSRGQYVFFYVSV